MKEVKFDLVLQVHAKLKEDELKECLEKFAINDVTAKSIVKKVIGEKGSPDNFYIDSMKIEKKISVKVTKPKKKAKSKK